MATHMPYIPLYTQEVYGSNRVLFGRWFILYYIILLCIYLKGQSELIKHGCIIDSLKSVASTLVEVLEG